MDLERLIESIKKKTNCTAEFTGDEEFPEYKLVFSTDKYRKQELILFPFEEDDKNFVRLITSIGDKSEFSDKKLIDFLTLNPSLRYGSFGIYQGDVVLQSAVRYESVVDEDKVIDQIKYLVRMADQFEEMLVGLDKK